MLNIGRLALLAGVASLAMACGQPRQQQSASAGWEKIYDRPVNYATAIEMFDDRFGLAVIGHGIERTTDGGRTWHETYSGEDAAAGIVIADAANAWVLAESGGLLHTTDSGQSWTRQAVPAPVPFVGVSAVSAEELWIAADRAPVQGIPPHGPSALVHSVDGGATWTSVDVPGYGIFLGVWFVGDDGWLLATQCHPGDPFDDPMAEPGEPGHAPCADQQTLLHTANDGHSWSPLPDAPAATNGAILRIDELRAYSRVGCRSDCTGRGLYRTDDGAQTWTEVGELPLGDLDAASGLRIAGLDGWLAVNQLDPPTIPPSAATFTERLAHTGDGGRTWELIDVPRDWSRAFDLAGSVLVGSGGDTGISLYDLASRRWQPASTDAGPDLTRFMFVTPDVGYATDRDYALWATDDGGATWSLRSDALNWRFAPDRVIWGHDKSLAVYVSDDGGRTTREVVSPRGQGPVSAAGIAAAAGNSIWLAKTDGLWRSDDAGSTWRHLDVEPLAQFRFIDAQHAWTETCGSQPCEGAIRLTSDGGDTWETRAVPPDTYIGDIVFSTALDGTAPARDPGGDCHCINVTHDGGRSWQRVSTAPWSLGRVIWLDASRAWSVITFLSTEQQPVIVSTADGGATWREEAKIDGGTINAQFVATAGRVWLPVSTTKPSFVDGATETPRRLLIYRRDSS